MIIAIIIMIIIIIALVVWSLFLQYKNNMLYDENVKLKRDTLKYQDAISMIEMNKKMYKEGTNPYTTMRNICNLLYNLEK